MRTGDEGGLTSAGTGADAGEPQAPGDPRLVEMAAAVAEGAPVDWAARAADAPELTGALAELKLLARMGDTMRAAIVPAPPREVAFRWGELEVVAKLGDGATGEVWRAWDPSLERDVALKLSLTQGGAGRPLEEARRLARLRHPNVVAVFGVDVREGRAGIWMEHLEGRTLEQTLAERGPFGAHEAAGIGLELCRALAAVHGAGLVHGDVSPRNVMRERGGRIVLMDLGSAAPLGEDAATLVTGTPLVTAPEVLAGEAPRAASDLYALACLLFRLVSGHYPVEAETLAELRAAHLAGRRLRLRLLRPELPGPFVQVVERALSSDPAARPADAASFERDLAGSLLPGTLAAQEEEQRRIRRVWGKALRPAALVSALVMLALVLSTQWFRRPPASGPVRAPDAPPVADVTPEAPAESRPLPAPRLEVASFIRTRAGLSERVESGSLVRVGDELSLDVRASEPLHVYVLNEDDEGAVFALFPVAGTDVANPLPAARTLALPGARAGEAMHWQVSSPASRERFLVIAAREPLAALEARLSGLPSAREDAPLAYAEIGPSDLEQLRGVGRLKPAGPSHRRGRALDDVAEALAGEAAVWVRAIELVHERD